MVFRMFSSSRYEVHPATCVFLSIPLHRPPHIGIYELLKADHANAITSAISTTPSLTISSPLPLSSLLPLRLPGGSTTLPPPSASSRVCPILPRYKAPMPQSTENHQRRANVQFQDHEQPCANRFSSSLQVSRPRLRTRASTPSTSRSSRPCVRSLVCR